MLFNSLQFALFFIIVYALYLALPHRWQNRMLLAASYVFYGSWDWRFLSLILASTILDYSCGRTIGQTKDIRRKKLFLFFSVCGNLSILGFFKYFNFFASGLYALLDLLGISVRPVFLTIMLPVGISFYTFKTMSYTIDVYKGRIEPVRKFFDYALFIAFFPQLLAGPIERAAHLLPQIVSPRCLSLEKVYEGCYLIFWGLFMKVFIADNLATIVDPVFSDPAPPAINVIAATYAFTFQIFCDFAGYSNIARGLGKCMGFDIMINFNLPYFASNPREFWQRWHISLSEWFRDYIYIPLGGNRKGALITYRNLLITMLLCALWHGAAWTFVVWGVYHGLLSMLHKALQPLARLVQGSWTVRGKSAVRLLKIVFFFHLVSAGWMIFRAESLPQMYGLAHSALRVLTRRAGDPSLFGEVLFYLWPLLLMQYLQYRTNNLLAVMTLPAWVRGLVYFAMYYLLVVYGVEGGKEFIYFQF